MTTPPKIGSRLVFVPFFLSGFALFFNCSISGTNNPFASIKNTIPPAYQPAVAQAVRKAGDNAHEVCKALIAIPAERIDWASFVIANMPQVDLSRMATSYLLENLELAVKTRDFASWSKSVPDDLFVHYVLPYRVSQEPLCLWRRMFYDSLSQRAGRLGSPVSMARAAEEVDRWCGELVKYKPTQSRDQSPLETIKSGFGRCEEIVIVQVCGYRSIGIPARQAWTPYWPHCDDNHAWTETWIDGKWVGTPAKRAALVFAPVYGVPQTDTAVYRKSNNFAILNVTGNYTKTGVLRIKTLLKGKPANRLPVTVSVFNYGSLRPIARLTTDRSGYAAVTIGEGEYFISGGTNKNHTWLKGRVGAGKTAEVILGLDEPKPLDGQFWLRYPDPG